MITLQLINRNKCFRRTTHLLKDVGRSHEAEADGLHDGVRVPPAAPVVAQPRLDGFIQLNFWEAAQSIAVQVRLGQKKHFFLHLCMISATFLPVEPPKQQYMKF